MAAQKSFAVMRAVEPSQNYILSSIGPCLSTFYIFGLELAFGILVQKSLGPFLVVVEVEKSVAACFSSPAPGKDFVMCSSSANLFFLQGYRISNSAEPSLSALSTGPGPEKILQPQRPTCHHSPPQP